MKNIRHLFLTPFLALFGLAICASCDRPEEDAAEDAAEAIEESADEAEDAVD